MFLKAFTNTTLAIAIVATSPSLVVAQEHRRQEEVELQPRIVGGKQAELGEYPYFAHLGNCGGALIAPSVVLTAAHCSDYKGKTIKVGAFSRGKDTKNSFKRKVVDDYLHPNFRKSNYQDDFSLLKLDKEVPMDHTDITLSVNFDPTVPKISDTVTVIGMGILEHGSHQLADKVRHLDMSVISDEQCSKDFHGKPVIEVQFCAGYQEGGRDACQGDSGGPLVMKNGTHHVQVGIVSAGSGCAEKGHPGIYSRISSREAWIKNIVCHHWQLPASFCTNTTLTGGYHYNSNHEHGGDWFAIKHSDTGKCATSRKELILEECNDSPEQLWTQYDNDYLIRSKVNQNRCIDLGSSKTMSLSDCFKKGVRGFEAYDDQTIRDKKKPNKCWMKGNNVDKILLNDCPIGTASSPDRKWETFSPKQSGLREREKREKEKFEISY